MIKQNIRSLGEAKKSEYGKCYELRNGEQVIPDFMKKTPNFKPLKTGMRTQFFGRFCMRDFCVRVLFADLKWTREKYFCAPISI